MSFLCNPIVAFVLKVLPNFGSQMPFEVHFVVDDPFTTNPRLHDNAATEPVSWKRSGIGDNKLYVTKAFGTGKCAKHKAEIIKFFSEIFQIPSYESLILIT